VQIQTQANLNLQSAPMADHDLLVLKQLSPVRSNPELSELGYASSTFRFSPASNRLALHYF